MVDGHNEVKLTKSESDEDQQEVNEPMLELREGEVSVNFSKQ